MRPLYLGNPPNVNASNSRALLIKAVHRLRTLVWEPGGLPMPAGSSPFTPSPSDGFPLLCAPGSVGEGFQVRVLVAPGCVHYAVYTGNTLGIFQPCDDGAYVAVVIPG